MYEHIRAVVLNTIKYNDRQNIVRVYTRERGMMAFAVSPGRTAAARQRAAMLLPLSLIEGEALLKPGRELATVRDLRRTAPLAKLYADPVRNAVALYVSELLVHAVQERERNHALFDFVEQSVLVLDAAEDGVANFHLCFTYRLGALLGVRPDTATWREGWWFDLLDGVFCPGPTVEGQFLRPDEARMVWLLSRMTFANMHRFRFSRSERNRILDVMLAYYRLHHCAPAALRSPEVLRQLFE